MEEDLIPMSNVGSMYQGRSFKLPSVSRFRSGHMPSEMTGSRVMDDILLSDMDTCSDSDGEGYTARYSLEASPQDDKISNGSSNQSSFLNGRTGGGHRGFSDRGAGRSGGYSAPHHGFVDDESYGSRLISDVSSIPARRNNAGILERKFNAGVDFSKRSDIDTPKRDRCSGLQFDDDVPSAPPLAGTFTHANQASGKPSIHRVDASPSIATASDSATEVESTMGKSKKSATQGKNPEVPIRTTAGVSSPAVPARYPTYHASGLGNWYAVLSYDACVRLCLNSWAKGCMEAPTFLENECALLRDAFGLRHILLQPEEELLKKESSELVSEGASVKTKKTIGKIKIQVRKVRMGLDPPAWCTYTSLKSTSLRKLETFQIRLSNVKSIVSSERKALKREHVPQVVTVQGSLFHRSMVNAIVKTRRYLKEVPELVKIGFNAWGGSASAFEVLQETYYCMLKLKSSPEEDAVRMQPGSGETRVFLPDGLGDGLVVEIFDSKGKYCGRAVVQVADIADEPGEKLRSCFVYCEPEHVQVGKVQLHVNYLTTPDENSYKCASVAETIAYAYVLETAMKVQQFQARNLVLLGSWRWLVNEFASYYGVSDAYTKLRYISYVMDVATPTADCLELVHNLLLPVLIKGKNKSTLSHQEVRILGEVSDEIEQILTLAFENYKSLDESSPTGLMDTFRPATGVAAPALTPALKLYKLLNDILTPEVQSKLCRYFQNASKKRSRQHLLETDEYVLNHIDNVVMDPMALSTAYKKMKALCTNIRNEILTDIQIHKQDLLPSFIDLPNLTSSIYSTELFSRLRAFLVSCPPPGPTPPVVELVIATANFQRDLSSWNVSYIKAGADAKELFHIYITLWIQDKRLSLLELCKFDKVKPPSIPKEHSTTSFIDGIYNRLKETVAEYDVIISRWPEYTFTLESAIADVEKAVVESLEKQYAEVLSPLKENTTMPMKFGLKYVQKLTKGGNVCTYNLSSELGVFLNSMKRMLDTIRPQIEAQVKSWGSCIPESGNMAPGECLSEVTVMIRSRFRAYVQSLTDKLVENTKLNNATKLKKIIQDARENLLESDLRQRMRPLKEILAVTIDQLHSVFQTPVFVIVCRAFWDRMGQDMLKFLEDRKENRSWYKGSCIAVIVLDDTFASQMQKLLGNALQEKDLEPPRCVLEVRSMLCKDGKNQKDNNYYY